MKNDKVTDSRAVSLPEPNVAAYYDDFRGEASRGHVKPLDFDPDTVHYSKETVWKLYLSTYDHAKKLWQDITILQQQQTDLLVELRQVADITDTTQALKVHDDILKVFNRGTDLLKAVRTEVGNEAQ